MAISANDKIVRGADLATVGAQVKAKLAEKQDVLVSGTSIKTLNGQPLLGSGNLVITDGEDIDQNAIGKLQFADRVYNVQQPDGMGYVILRKNKTFAEQVTAENTIYEIRYDFVLNNDVTIPSECVIHFNGGSLSGNGTLTFNNTIIEGNAKITCNIAGSILGQVNVGWFGLVPNDNTFDNGVIINKVAAVFKNILIPQNVYYVMTPVVMDSMRMIDCRAYLYWRGDNTNCAAVSIRNTFGGYFSFYMISGYEARASLDFQGDGGTNLRGIDIVNCNNSTFRFNELFYLNEGFRICGDGAGCSYNAFFIGKIRNTNRAIRIYQDNAGWCNENKIYNGRIYCESQFVSASINRYALYIKGPGTASDTYNSVNALFVGQVSMEGYPIAIYAYNTSFSAFKSIRAEGVSTLVKFIGASRNNIVNWSFPGTILYDSADCTSYPLATDNERNFLIKDVNLLHWKQCYKDGAASTMWEAQEGVPVMSTQTDSHYFAAYSWTMTVSGTSRATGAAKPCIILDVTNSKTFFICSDLACRFLVYQLETTGGTTINLGTSQQNYLSPLGRTPNIFSYNSSVRGWSTASDATSQIVHIRDSRIKKICIAVSGTLGRFTIYSLDNRAFDIEQALIKREGDTASRPTNKTMGQTYFDTTLGKMIVWNGTAWTNMDGSTLS